MKNIKSLIGQMNWQCFKTKKAFALFSLILLLGIPGYIFAARPQQDSQVPVNTGRSLSNSYSSPWDQGFYSDFSAVHHHMNQMMRQMNRLFYDDSDPWGRGFYRPGPATSAQFDVKQTKDAIIVTCDLPGMDKEKIEINVEDDFLTISAQREEAKEEKKDEEDGRYLYRSVKSYGQFSKSFGLPEGVDPAQIDAQYDKGVLTITIPYEQPKEERSFKVDVN